jgi:hypothetical protein
MVIFIEGEHYGLPLFFSTQGSIPVVGSRHVS